MFVYPLPLVADPVGQDEPPQPVGLSCWYRFSDNRGYFVPVLGSPHRHYYLHFLHQFFPSISYDSYPFPGNIYNYMCKSIITQMIWGTRAHTFSIQLDETPLTQKRQPATREVVLLWRQCLLEQALVSSSEKLYSTNHKASFFWLSLRFFCV